MKDGNLYLSGDGTRSISICQQWKKHCLFRQEFMYVKFWMSHPFCSKLFCSQEMQLWNAECMPPWMIRAYANGINHCFSSIFATLDEFCFCQRIGPSIAQAEFESKTSWMEFSLCYNETHISLCTPS